MARGSLQVVRRTPLEYDIYGHALVRPAILTWCEENFGKTTNPPFYRCFGVENRWSLDYACSVLGLADEQDAVLFSLRWVGTQEVDWDEAHEEDMRRRGFNG